MRTLFLLVYVLLFPVVLYAQPSISFDSETKDYGSVTAGNPIEHVFEVRNGGDKELVIDKLVPS